MKFLGILFALTITCIASRSQNDLSPALDIPREGWNKVLCLKNGKTILIHTEIGKPLMVKVFDSMHHEIASQKISCRYMDISKLRETMYKGLIEVDNEAVLFLQQERLSRYVLIRLRINTSDGTLISEDIAAESPGLGKRTQFYVMKSPDDNDHYAIFFCTDIPQFNDCKLNVSYYNRKHEVEKEVPLTLDRKKYDALEVLGAEWQPAGISVTLNLKKFITSESVHTGDISNTISVYDHVVYFFYIKKNSQEAVSKSIDVTTDIYPFYSHFTYNPFTQAFDQMLLSYQEYSYRYGTDIQPGSVKSSLFFSTDERTMEMRHSWIKNQKANLFYKQQTDSTKVFEGLPLRMFTGDNGVSTVVFRSFTRYKDVESNQRLLHNSYLGPFCITQFNDEGDEVWGTMLPNSQFFKSYTDYYPAYELGKDWQGKWMFFDLPEQVYDRQFFSENIYSCKGNYYVIFNEYNKNFHNSMSAPGDTVISFSNTNACYYKLTRRREVSKNYVFGTPAPGEYKSSFVESADFDAERSCYAALVQYKKDNEVTLRMAWSHLE